MVEVDGCQLFCLPIGSSMACLINYLCTSYIAYSNCCCDGVLLLVDEGVALVACPKTIPVTAPATAPVRTERLLAAIYSMTI